MINARLVFPHQLFTAHYNAPIDTLMVLVEDDLFYKQFPFHKQKLILHRAALRHFADTLREKGFSVNYIETADSNSMETLQTTLQKHGVTRISYYDVVDDWLQRALDKLPFSAERLVSPSFMTSPGQIDEYFGARPNRMQLFYEWQRRRLNIMMDGDKPAGGKWSYDTANRKKLPKNITLPAPFTTSASQHIREAQTWVEQRFADNPGDSQSFNYPVTHEQAAKQLDRFLQERLENFGPYEDAIARDASQVFHSLLSPLINCGLLTPQQVVDTTLVFAAEHAVPIESLEGFIRQIIGWREYMRATYVRYGTQMRTSNHLQLKRSLGKSWWDGTTGIDPIDTTIKRVLQTGYAHHIERLMVLGNALVLLRIKPDDVYGWFMSLFIDAYDWVMVPNVYAMSQFAAGTMITTKPYISGSNYLLKMSDYTKGDWAEVWDALYWQFINDHREMILQNYRMRMVVTIYDRFDAEKRERLQKTAQKWLR